MSLLGTYTQVSGPTFALGAKLCTLSIAATSADNTQFERTWCDSTNTTIAQESWRVPTSASRGWLDGQRVSSRLWAAQVFTGVEYDVSAPRAAHGVEGYDAARCSIYRLEEVEEALWAFPLMRQVT